MSVNIENAILMKSNSTGIMIARPCDNTAATPSAPTITINTVFQPELRKLSHALLGAVTLSTWSELIVPS